MYKNHPDHQVAPPRNRDGTGDLYLGDCHDKRRTFGHLGGRGDGSPASGDETASGASGGADLQLGIGAFEHG